MDDKLPDQHLAAIEQAMVALRRSQRSRRLARLARSASLARPTGSAGSAPGGNAPTAIIDPGGAVYDVIDVVEAAEQAGEQATVSTVAAALDVAQPRASKLVAAAVEAGLLRREADQTDGRRTVLARTDAGRALSDAIHRFRRHTFAAITDGWSDDDRATFARLLTRFAAGMDDLARHPSASPHNQPPTRHDR